MFLQTYSVSVKEVMKKDIYFIDIEENFCKVFDYLMKNSKKEVLVLKEGKLDGIITISDISKMVDKDISQIAISDVMTDNLISIGTEETLANVRLLMLKNCIGRIPVLSNNKVVGIIREEIIRDYFYRGVEESEQAIEHIFDNISEAVCVLDNKGRVVIWNKNAEKLYGLKIDEIKGKPLRKYFPNAIDLKIFETKESVKNIYHSPKEGYHVIISASPIIINDKLYGVISTEKDISEIEELQKELKKAKDKIQVLENKIDQDGLDPFDRIIGHSKKIIDKIDIAKQIAPTNVSVLLTGESGTGKEEFAKAIHKYSGLSGKFVPVNCSAIPSELFESEFFGYERGAFTGARKEGKIGFFELAKDGTLFLDEIGDLPLSMQAKLLRVLQDKKIKKVGGERYIPVDVRIISATNKNLVDMIEKKQFREDLYYRINVIEIELPPLRERKEDIVLFIDYFLKEICIENDKEVLSINNDVVNFLIDYPWRGNIRELRNVIEHMAIMCRGDTITKDLIPKYMLKDGIEGFYSMDLNKSVENLEIFLIKEALRSTNGSRIKAAKLLNIPRTTLHSKMKKYHLYD
ncbi:PAS domain S-box-containing protein [Keratinibaculum paraultunense]|uniref:PAS domain S-box-containing protein n=1 Tax=Keratinibaculum paraultunense TaxID=1278232 RepID=A0A4R3KZ95_9FIRM|nr:sigma-54 dependent transcriptional regulator PrdR [Keratinibaculum paraultunense]QQY80215.1 sigma 54-interacting transcriptional regulator [Keratinibaculum paraultunense]TCS90727.1 PAS domain S-box-containing protein [Keratinibaculum paraultunense]